MVLVAAPSTHEILDIGHLVPPVVSNGDGFRTPTQTRHKHLENNLCKWDPGSTAAIDKLAGDC